MNQNENLTNQFISIKEASWISVLLVVLMFVFSLPGIFIENVLAKGFLELFSYISASCILIFLVLKKHNYIKLSFSKIGKQDSLLLIPLALSLVILSEFLIGLIPINPKMAEVFTGIFSFSPAMFILTVICAPPLEEIICRGIIQEGLSRNYSIAKSIFWSAFLFGSIHLNPWQFVAGFLIGLVCGWVFYLYKNLVPSILIHFVINFVSMLGQIFVPELSHFGDNTTKLLLGGNELIYYSVLFVCTVIFSICIFFIHKKVPSPSIQTIAQTTF